MGLCGYIPSHLLHCHGENGAKLSSHVLHAWLITMAMETVHLDKDFIAHGLLFFSTVISHFTKS